MNIHLQPGFILITSNRLIDILASIAGHGNWKRSRRTMGFAIFPCFIFLRNLTHPMTRQWINHERIHLKQFIESLGFFYIISKIEYVYARLILHYLHQKAYFFEEIERECYLNQHDILATSSIV